MMAPDKNVPFEFQPKRWMLWVSVCASGSLFFFTMVMGLLFAMGMMTNVRGEEQRNAGFIMVALGLLIFLPWLMVGVGQVVFGRGFLLKICREGLVYRTVGRMGLDSYLLVPGMIRIWARCFSGAAFRREYHLIEWAEFAGVEVKGFRAAQTLRIQYFESRNPLNLARVEFRDANFQAPLGQIAEAIWFYSQSGQNQGKALPGWDDQDTFAERA